MSKLLLCSGATTFIAVSISHEIISLKYGMSGLGELEVGQAAVVHKRDDIQLGLNPIIFVYFVHITSVTYICVYHL